MPAYPWMTHAWVVQAETAERSARPFLSQRRWTDKDAIVAMASPPLMFGWGATTGWPEVPRGVGADFEGERALRVFLEITDGPEKRPLAPEAILFARLSGADAARANLKKGDEFLVVPLKFFVWVAGALSFDKKVLLSLGSKIKRHSLDYDDAEIGPEIVWITPMKEEDRRYYYSVLPLVGMGGVIDPAKGNPSFFAGVTTLRGVDFPGIQPDPLRHTVWWIVDRVIGAGITSWGNFAPGRNGEGEILAIKLRLVNFLRDLADQFVLEELHRRQRRGDLSLKDINKAFGDGLFAHLPDAERVARENDLLEQFHSEVQMPRARRLADKKRLAWSFAEAIRFVGGGYGEWAGSARADREADRWLDLAWRMSRSKFLREVANMLALGYADPELGSKLAETTLKAFFSGDISERELAIFADQSPFGQIINHLLDEKGSYERGAAKKWLAKLLVEHDSEVAYITGEHYHG